MAGFSFANKGGGTDITQTRTLDASQTVARGDALELSNGKLIAADDAAAIIHAIAKEAVTTAAAEESDIKVTPVKGRQFFVNITPLHDDVAADSNSTATSVVFTDAAVTYSNDDLNGGVVYCEELGESRVIKDSSVSSTTATLTVEKAFTRAITTGDTVRVFPRGVGQVIKLGHSGANFPNTILNTANQTGGKMTIHEVDPILRRLLVSFNES